MPLTPRQRELTARHLLAHPEQIPVYLKQRKWEPLAALVEFASKDAPLSLAHTDPALYRLLRQQITDFRLRGWSCLDLKKLQELANAGSGPVVP
jgi:hypothetical protein